MVLGSDMSDSEFIQGNPYGRWIHEIGSRPERPFRFSVPLRVESFGDVFVFVACAARIASQFEHSHCTFFHNDSRPYLIDVAKMYPGSKTIAGFKGDWDSVPHVAIAGQLKNYDHADPFYQDLTLNSATLTTAIFFGLPRVPLAIPEPLIKSGHKRLIELGLDEHRWFCTIHWREPNYRFKPISNFRDADPEAFLQAIDYIIDELGGQVVQLGHPEMRHHKPRPGLVDLACEVDNWNLQAFAVSRSRFFVGSASGATVMAQAFCVPSAHIDNLEWYTGGPDDVVVTPTVNIDGATLRQETLYRSGFMNSYGLTAASRAGKTVQVTPTTYEDVAKAIDLMAQRTENRAAWQVPAVPELAPPNCLKIPVSAGAELFFVPL